MRFVSLLLLLMACLAIVAVLQFPISANADSANFTTPLHQWLADCDGSTRCSETAPQTPPPPKNPLIPWLDPNLRLALEQYKSATTEQDAFSAFNLVLLALPKIQEGNETLYVLEDDLPSSREDVCSWVKRITGKTPPPTANCAGSETPNSTVQQTVSGSSGDELVAATNPNCKSYWPEGRNANALCIWNELDRSRLTYAIDKSSFSDVPAAVVQDLELALDEAIRSWESACPQCGLKFTKVMNIESLTAAEKLDYRFFSITYQQNCGAWAQAFFPYVNHRRWEHNSPLSFPRVQHLNVYQQLLQMHPGWRGSRCPAAPSASTKDAQWSHTLRHELGHILGYQHEQMIEPDFGNCVDASDGSTHGVQQISAPDRASVMHSTRCKELGFAITGQLSQLDKSLHMQFYRRY